MTLKNPAPPRIPAYVQFLYQYFAIPKEEWAQHYALDSGINNYLRPEVSKVYRSVYRSIVNEQRLTARGTWSRE